MNILKSFKTVAIGVAFVVAGAVSSQAATISNSDTQTHILPGFGFMSGFHTAPGAPVGDSQNHNGSYTLQQFNGALGTLNSVRIEFNQAVNSTIDDTGGTCAPGFSDCAVNLTRTFTQSGAVTLGSASGATSSIFDTDTVNCVLGLAPNACFQSTHAHASPFTEAIDFTSASDVANFVGGGTFSVTTDLLATFLAELTAETIDLSSGAGFDWAGTATVIYDYTEASTQIPAPAGAAFLALGLAALARRKRA